MRRSAQLMLLVAAGLLAAAAGTVLAVSVNVATGGAARGIPAIEWHPWWWSAGATAAVAGAGLMTWWAQRRYERALLELVPAVQRPEPWVVDRPSELVEVVRALRGRGVATVGITTAVHGAGGFGKTTLAKLVRADARVVRRFGRRVYWVTLGRDLHGAGLVESVNNLALRIDPSRAQPTAGLRQAAEQLAAVLADGPRRLVILDDVWSEDQLAAFPVAGRSARLVTTRSRSLLAGRAIPVRVDRMSPEQARTLLVSGLPQRPSPAVVDGLLDEAGNWPLLVRLMNKILVKQALSRTDVTALGQDLLEQLRRNGALRVDTITGAAARQLDVDDPDQRADAVAATIEASTGLLCSNEYDRFAELAIFAEDETIPVPLVARLWSAAGMSEIASRALCARLADLALIALTPTNGGGTLSLHDVVRDYLAEHLRGTKHLGPPEITRLHQVLLDAVTADLPDESAVSGPKPPVAWWQLPEDARYLREHLIDHLLAADRHGEAERLATDLRWVQVRLQEAGPLAVLTDLALVNSPRARRLKRLLEHFAHLLAPTEPAPSRLDIFYSRVSNDPDWGPPARVFAAQRTPPALICTWPMPDLPHPALLRSLTAHTGAAAVVVAPDGTWLATAGGDGVVRIWDAVAGQERVQLTGRIRGLSPTQMAIAPDGSWLATAGYNGTIRTWDAVTGRERAVLTGHAGPVSVVVIAPDGTWLATAGRDGTARIWDAVTGRERAVLTGHAGPVSVVVIAPDGTWLATAGRDGTARIWDAVTGRERAMLNGQLNAYSSPRMAIAPDGTWLATAGRDGRVRIWDAATGRERARLIGHTGLVSMVVIAPDGTWFATAGSEGGKLEGVGDDTVRIWDTLTGRERTLLTGHVGAVSVVVIAPDGSWLATAGPDGTVRIWDPISGQESARLAGHTRDVTAMVVSPDGSWLATAGRDGTVRIWDASADGRSQTTGHVGRLRAMTVAPNGTWLVTAGRDGSVRIWDATSGRERAALTGHPSGFSQSPMVIAPDGTWLATTGRDGAVRIWNPVSGQEHARLAGHTSVDAMVVAQDGTWLATAGRAGGTHILQIWDATRGRARSRRNVDASSRVVAISPDGTWFATAGTDGKVRVWDAAGNRAGPRRTVKTGMVLAVAISPDGTWLATTDLLHRVRIWETATGRERGQHTDGIGLSSVMAIAPDGSWLATTGRGGTVVIRDTSSGRERTKLTGHTGEVSVVAITPDGAWVATTTTDGTVRIWSPGSGSCVAMMRVEREITACAWSPVRYELFAGGPAGLYRFDFKPPIA
ncbi:NB-ARC domain-containing protein [Micromonospora sp. CPCC 205539]|uniref:NB-ARC domain-containing protein n=1 Tax=Micromonospora sp. CPCC 205539 TaxID=3122408 RepID=UPI002FF1148B